MHTTKGVSIRLDVNSMILTQNECSIWCIPYVTQIEVVCISFHLIYRSNWRHIHFQCTRWTSSRIFYPIESCPIRSNPTQSNHNVIHPCLGTTSTVSTQVSCHHQLQSPAIGGHLCDHHQMICHNSGNKNKWLRPWVGYWIGYWIGGWVGYWIVYRIWCRIVHSGPPQYPHW